MELLVDRFIFAKDYTMSRVYVNNNLFCYGLEPYDAGIDKYTDVDEILEYKKQRKIAIPLGNYTMEYGWSNRYKQNMPKIIQVPGFAGILWHIGNTEKDTNGCLLIGKFYNVGMLYESRKTFEEFMKMWKAANFENNNVLYRYAAEYRYLY